MLSRRRGLIKGSASNTTTQILQSLLTFASQPQGAAALWTLADLSPIVHMAPEEPLALQVIDYLVRDGATRVLMERTIRHSFDKIMSTLVASFKNGQSQQLLEYLAGLLPNIGPEVRASCLTISLLLIERLDASPLSIMACPIDTAHPSFNVYTANFCRSQSLYITISELTATLSNDLSTPHLRYTSLERITRRSTLCLHLPEPQPHRYPRHPTITPRTSQLTRLRRHLAAAFSVI